MKREHICRVLSLILAGALLLTGIFALCCCSSTNNSENTRKVIILRKDGQCKVERDGKVQDAKEGFSLRTDDTIIVGENGSARVRLDEDKYLYIDQSSRVRLVADGTAESSKTVVFVERGSVMTEVKNKLSSDSSFNIITPNTTMSIRGTKTLTEVIEDAVTGAVQTSNAVLEGKVKIKAVKVKADGTVVSVERDFGVGDGCSFKSTKEELVSQTDMLSLSGTGATTSGIKVEIVSEVEADVEFDVATFNSSLLENIKNILIADSEADAGEEGLSQEQIDEIDGLLGDVLEKLEEISAQSQEKTDDTDETDFKDDSDSLIDLDLPSDETQPPEQEKTDSTSTAEIIKDDSKKPCLIHDYMKVAEKPATCTSDGWKEYIICKKCSFSTYKKIEALGHSLVSHKAKEATCEGIGWEAYETCSRCSYSTYKQIDALGHNYGKWNVTTEPYPVFDTDNYLAGWHVGEKIKTCSRCTSVIKEPVLLTPELMCEWSRIEDGLMLPIDMFTDFDTEYYGADPLLKDILNGNVWAISPMYDGEFVEVDATVTFVDGNKRLSELKLREGSKLKANITVKGEYRNTYEDTTVTITIVASGVVPIG